MVDHGEGRVTSAARPKWIFPFDPPSSARRSGWSPNVVEGGVADGRPARKWSLDLAKQMLPAATYRSTNLTARQIGTLLTIVRAIVRAVGCLGVGSVTR